MPIVDCGIPVASDDVAYLEGLNADVFITDASGKPYIGQVNSWLLVYRNVLSDSVHQVCAGFSLPSWEAPEVHPATEWKARGSMLTIGCLQSRHA